MFHGHTCLPIFPLLWLATGSLSLGVSSYVPISASLIVVFVRLCFYLFASVSLSPFLSVLGVFFSNLTSVGPSLFL